jgi:U3 small nucleolar RNA-associated protein 3
MIQASETLNLVLYLLLKSDQASTAKKMNNDTTTTPFLMDIVDTSDDIANHPVIQRLNQLSILTDKLQAGVEDKMPGLNDQMKNLVKAATLMAGGHLSLSDNDDGSETRENASSKEGDERIVESLDGSKQHDKHDEDEMNRNPRVKKPEIYRKALISRKDADEYEKEEEEEDDDDDDDESSSESDDQYETQEAVQRKVMTEAKFALRNQDIDQDMKYLTKKRVHRLAPPAMSSDYGDETDEVTDQTLMASRKLASMMNSIVQKSSSSNDKRNKSMARDDDEEDDYDKVQRGLSMMEEELGKGSDDDDDDDEDGDDDDEGLRDDEDDFYKSIKSKSKARKDAKKVMYEVAPKFPRLDIMVDGERAIGGQIMKNRGLVPHKPKINRNPRVKKREKYRKALISRKGAVREIRTEEGHVYGGETTGIKSGISRSRKLGR